MPAPQQITVDDVLKAIKQQKIRELLSDDQISQIAAAFSTKDVSAIHRNADTDNNNRSGHHTLGSRAVNAASGTHSHDGEDSVSLLDGTIISGSRSTATASVLGQVLAALVTLGVTDSTSA